MLELLHPVTVAYAISFASIFAWPAMAPESPGAPCRDIASDWFVVVAGVFACAIAHSLYALWLVERVAHYRSKCKKPDDPMLDIGEAVARGGTFGTWSAYFGFRLALHSIVTLALYAAEHKCIMQYGQMLGPVLVADATFTFFSFAASWSVDRLSKDAAAAKKTRDGEGEEEKEGGARKRRGVASEE